MADTSYGNKDEDDSSDVEPMDVDCGSSKIASADEAGSSGGSSKKRREEDDEHASSAVRSKVPKVIEDYEALKKELEEERRLREEERRLREEAEKKAVVERRRREIAEEKAVEERRLRETAEEKAVEERRLRKEERRRNFMTTVDYLIEELKVVPQCTKNNCFSRSGPSYHWSVSATLKDIPDLRLMDVGTLKGPSEGDRTSVVLPLSKENGIITWGSENDIARMVISVIDDVLKYLGAWRKVDVLSELAITSLRPDIWLLYKVEGGISIPFAVVEVKKPSYKDEDEVSQMRNKNFAGQLYGYMVMLKELWGIKNPIGIMSTYSYWRVCTLQEGDWHDLAMKDSPTEYKPLLQVSGWLNTKDDTDDNGDVSEEEKIPEGVLFCTKPERRDSEGVLVLIVNALWRAIRADQGEVNPKTAEVALQFNIESGRYGWVKNPFNQSTLLSSTKMPPKGCSNFYLLHDLRFGAHGRVWMAASKSGKVCVLKMVKLKVFMDGMHEKSLMEAMEKEKEAMEKEVHLWHIMTPEQKDSIYVSNRNKRIVLVIPYCRPLTEDERKTEDTRNGIMENITKLLEQGWDHGDLIGDDEKTFKWHHVGIFNQNQLCLLDFGAAKRIKPEEVEDYKQKYRAVLFPEANPLSV